MKLLRGIQLMFIRNMRQTLRSPIFVFVSLFQPLLYLFLFMPLLNGLGGVPGLPAGKTVQIFIPGLLVMMALFGSAFVGFNLIDDIRSGVIERFLVTPVNRSAILLGRVLRDAVVLLTQCVLITLVAIPLGLSVNVGGFLLSLVLYAMVSITMASMSYSFALIYRIEDPLAPTLNTITLPLSLLSGIMLPLALAPLWLQDLAKANPFSYAVNASRALFAGSFHSVDIIKGFVIVFLLMSVVFWWSLNSLRKLEE
ncbi:ABC transporter permease [Candidatus Cryosericum hinesii]|jgi:ABC-2 type transport system permease protein|uniref:Transport permease protein n=1 Tax=Candidatus Cryosericum hinesii TaxID=2290915 RepID=A0A398DDT1_9BACT|nr:ABC transporter permease [Candidatus Cryosericum hinesii]RIE08452.1 ABC transporter permease [Candidatus Cryosericum hinesii]RIE11799.1 ABC transporter permease [Candidatus Cryosericum hinesii]